MMCAVFVLGHWMRWIDAARAADRRCLAQDRFATALELAALGREDEWGTTGEALDAYTQNAPFESGAYPQDWVIGTDGRVAYLNNSYEPDEIIETLESELAGK